MNSNPFIDTNDRFTEAERLQTTVYSAVNVFAVLEKLFEDPPDGADHIRFGLEEYTGLQRIIAGAKAALNHVANEILEMEFQSRKDCFAQLTPDQRETIQCLVGDIANGDINPVNVATRDSARIVLARFEAESEKMSAEECAAELDRYQFGTGLPDFQGAYKVSKNWTLKGLRHTLARERFMETITCNIAGESPADEEVES